MRRRLKGKTCKAVRAGKINKSCARHEFRVKKMKNLVFQLKKEKYLIFYLLVSIVLIPICTYGALNADAHYRTILSIPYFFVLSFCFYLLKGGSRKIAAWTYFLFTLVPNIVIISFFVMSGTIMHDSGFWVIFDTNRKEVNDFLSQFFSVKLLCVIIVYLSISLLFAIKVSLQTEKATTPKFKLLISVCVFFAISLLFPFRSQISTIDFYKSFYHYCRELKELAEFYENRKNANYEVTSGLNDSVPKTFVVVIGESANRNHYSLYGYPRCTNQKLQEIENRHELLVYDNVISPFTYTMPALNEVLTFANYENPSLYKRDASIVELLKSAGYKTYWIAMQGNEKFDFYVPTSFRNIAIMSDVYITPTNDEWDENAIPLLSNILKDTVDHKVIFIHLIGSHFDYSNKSPKEYKIFDFKKDTIVSLVKDKLGEREKKIIDEYDNSILYNDFVLSSIIDELKKINGIAFMLYFSDHGDEVFDTEFYANRASEKITRGMCEIPFILWCNDEFKKISKLEIDKHRAYCTDDVIHSILDLTKIYYPLFEEKRSIFSSQFEEKQRKVEGHLYEDLK